MFGGHTNTAVPTLSIQGGTVTNSGANVHNALNNVTLNNGVWRHHRRRRLGSLEHQLGQSLQTAAVRDELFDGNGQIMLQSGDQSTPKTAFQVQTGTLTVASPLIDGRNSSSVNRTTGLVKSGAGTLVLNGATAYTGSTTVTNGTLQLGPAAQNAVFTLGGADVQAGKLVSTMPLQSIPHRRSPRSWTPATGTVLIRSPPARFTVRPRRRPAWRSVNDNTSAQAVTVMYTLPGDADLSGTVDFSDLNTVLSYYNKPGTWVDGDFNYDGIVNLADLNSVLSFYDKSVPVVIDARTTTWMASTRCLGRRRHQSRARTVEPHSSGRLPLSTSGLCLAEAKVNGFIFQKKRCKYIPSPFGRGDFISTICIISVL